MSQVKFHLMFKTGESWTSRVHMLTSFETLTVYNAFNACVYIVSGHTCIYHQWLRADNVVLLQVTQMGPAAQRCQRAYYTCILYTLYQLYTYYVAAPASTSVLLLGSPLFHSLLGPS